MTMKKLNLLLSVFFLGGLLFSSCSKQVAINRSSLPATQGMVKLESKNSVIIPSVTQNFEISNNTVAENQVTPKALPLTSAFKMQVQKNLIKGFLKSGTASVVSVKAAPFKEKSTHKKAEEPDKILMILLCLFIPPLAVYLHTDDIGKDFIINLILCVVGCGIAGIIHAFIVCFKK